MSTRSTLEEELTNSGEHLNASRDNEIIMTVPENAEPLRQALQRTGGANQATCGIGTLTVTGLWQSSASTCLRQKVLPLLLGPHNGEGWKARSVPAPRPLFN